MANLGKKHGTYLARFRYQGKEYKRSLKTADRAHAVAALRRVEDTLHWLAIGTITIPEGVDPGAFIVSGGTLTAPPSRPESRSVPSLAGAIQEYTAKLGHLAESNRATVGGHLRNLKRSLGPKAESPIDRIEARDLEAFVQARLKDRCSTTVAKEQTTLLQFFRWAVNPQRWLPWNYRVALGVSTGETAPTFGVEPPTK